MAKDVNLTSNEWCDLIFEGKNKKFGAYYLRKTSSKRHFKSLMIVLGICIVLILLPTLLDKVLPETVQDETINEAVKMTEVELNKPEPEQQVVEAVPPPPVLKEAIRYTPPVIDRNATDDDNMKTQEEVTQSKAVIYTQDVAGSNEEGAVDPGTLVVQKAITVAPKVVEPFDVVEQMPEFPGGPAELNKFLNNAIRYPIIAQENNISGRVTVKFAVGADGTISRVTIARGVDKTLDDEAIRVVKSMPKWIPGRQNGVAVAVYYTVPVTFRLDQR